MSTATATETDNRITAEQNEAGIGWPDLGKVVMSCGVAAKVAEIGCGDSLVQFVCKHQTKDWGELDEEDRAANDEAIITGARILSAYTWRGKKIWIITEAVGDDGRRECTTILFPHEY